MGIYIFWYIGFGLMLFGIVNLIRPVVIKRSAAREILLVAAILFVLTAIAAPSDRKAVEYAKTLPRYMRFFPGISLFFVFILLGAYAVNGIIGIIKKFRRKKP